ncbi:MAG: PAS domain S-box protein [Methanolobus sp.]
MQLTNFSLYNFSDPVFWTESDGHFFYVNKAACRHLGYSEEELLTMNVLDIDPDFGPDIWKKHWKEIEEKKSFVFESRHRIKSGEIIPVEITVNHMDYNEKEYNCAFVKDITERKKIEKGLRLTSFSLENFSDPVLWTKENGDIFYVNEASCNLFCYSKEEFLSKCVMEINPLLTIDKWKEHWKELQDKKMLHFETLKKTKAGELIPVEITANYMNYEGNEYNCAIIKDIRKLKRTKKRLELACFSLENFAEPVAWINDKAEFIYVNKAACELLGYTKKELLSLTVFDISSYHTPELWEKRWEKIKNKTESRIEAHFIKKSGENVPVSISSTYMNYEGKEYICSFATDITERKKVEKDLLMSFFALENSFDSIFWIKSDGQIFYVNKAACDLLGFTEEELLSISVPDVNPNFTSETWKEHWEDIKSKKTFCSESTLYTRSGETLPVEITSSYLNYEGDEYHCAFIRDISERKKSEKALRESEEKLISMVTNIADVIAIVDKDGINRYKSPNVEKWFGWKPEELVGNCALDLMHPDDFTKVQKALFSIYSKPKASTNIEARYRCKDGNYKWTQFTAINLFDEPAINGCLVNYHDISQRKASEKALLESQAQLRSLVDTAPDLVWLKDKKGVYLACNTRFESLFGAKETEIVGKTDYDFVDKELADFFIGTDKKAIESGKPISFEEELTYADDGHKECLETIKSPVNDKNGQLLGVLGIARDITQRKKSEEELKLASFSLENSSDAVFWMESNGRIFYVNEAACKLLGYSKQELLSLSIPDINPTFTQESWNTHWEKMKLGRKYHIETKLRTKTGKMCPVDVTSAYMNYKGKEYDCAFVRDLTERKKYEKELIESEEKMRLFVEHAPVAVAMFDRQMHYILASKRWISDYFLEGKEIIGKSHYDIFPEIPDEWKDMHRRAMKGESIPVKVTPFERADGRIQWVHGEVKPWKKADGTIGGISLFSVDITERKNAEIKLLESEAQLRSLVDTAQDLVWLKDVNGAFLACNTRFESLYGAKEAEIAGNTDYDFVDKETADFFRGMDKKAIESGGSIIFEELVTYADGHKEYLETIKSPVHDANGKLIGVLGVGRDVTQRKKSEEELKKASFSLENSSDPIFWKGKEGEILYVNKAACNLLDYSKEELLLMSVFDICPEATKDTWDQYWNVIKRDNIGRGETKLRTRTGKMCPVEVVSNYMNYEGKEYECSFMRDLTERHKYEKALEEEIKERRSLMEQSKDGIVILDSNGKVFEANQAYAIMLGYSMEEMQSLHVWDWDFNYSRKQLINMCRTVDENGVHLETRQRRKDGKVIDVDINSNSVQIGEKNGIVHMQGYNTEEKRRK